jgi:hypothetical protein
MNYYNGYSPKERNKKLAALHRLYPNYSHPYYKPPCHLCGDPTAEVGRLHRNSIIVGNT